MILQSKAANRARLRVSLSAVPPRDDIALIAANVPMRGTFENLPEGSEVSAEHAGRVYRWTLSYRGGKSKADLVLRDVRGHADDAPRTRVRAVPETPTPLWTQVPARAELPKDAIPAFEGAEGFGAVSQGGRGGKVLTVENLNDNGPEVYGRRCPRKDRASSSSGSAG